MSNLAERLRNYRKNKTVIEYRMNLFDMAADKIEELEAATMLVCKKCHSQLDSNGDHYQMTDCVKDKIKQLKKRIEELEEIAVLYENSRGHLSATNKVVDDE